MQGCPDSSSELSIKTPLSFSCSFMAPCHFPLFVNPPAGRLGSIRLFGTVHDAAPSRGNLKSVLCLSPCPRAGVWLSLSCPVERGARPVLHAREVYWAIAVPWQRNGRRIPSARPDSPPMPPSWPGAPADNRHGYTRPAPRSSRRGQAVPLSRPGGSPVH